MQSDRPTIGVFNSSGFESGTGWIGPTFYWSDWFSSSDEDAFAPVDHVDGPFARAIHGLSRRNTSSFEGGLYLVGYVGSAGGKKWISGLLTIRWRT